MSRSNTPHRNPRRDFISLKSSLGSDIGAAPIEFLTFGIPAVLVLLIALQLLLAGYVGNIALDAAIEGSAQAAAADGSFESGVARATEVMLAAAPWINPSIEAESGVVAGDEVTQITVVAPVTVLSLAAFDVEMKAWSINERD